MVGGRLAHAQRVGVQSPEEGLREWSCNLLVKVGGGGGKTPRVEGLEMSVGVEEAKTEECSICGHRKSHHGAKP